jgi:hypothetical protein
VDTGRRAVCREGDALAPGVFPKKAEKMKKINVM